MDAKPIPKEEMKAAHRRLCRQLAAVIASAMHFRDMGFAAMAVRIDKKEKTVRGWFNQLIDGKSKGVDLREIADMMTALDCRLDFKLIPKEDEPAQEPPAPTESAGQS